MKRAALGLSALLAVVSLLVAPAAQAHSELVGSTPEDGAVLTALPTEVSLIFSEDLLPETVNVSVADGDGNVVRIAAPAVEGPEVLFPWPGWPGTPASDTWTVNYRVVSQDGHPVSGSLSAAGAASAAASPGPAAASPAPAASVAATPADEGGSPSVAPILMIVAGLAAGIGIGLAFAARRRRGPSA